MSYWPWLMTVLLLLAAAVLAGWAGQGATSARRAAKYRFDDLLKVGLEPGTSDNGWILRAIERMVNRPAPRWLTAPDQDELLLLLRQANWSSEPKRTLFSLSLWLAPLVGATVVETYALSAGESSLQTLALGFVGFILGFVAPRRLLRLAARRRQHAIAKEVPVAIHMLCMLFDAGLSTEPALRLMHDKGRTLMPNLAEEIGIALQRIQAGQDQADALGDMATPLSVPELTDTVAILRQVTRHGGNIRDSLMKFAGLIEERQHAALREWVGKLSAKMTVVMVVFLFPALMIFLAGPGFLALGRALVDVYG